MINTCTKLPGTHIQTEIDEWTKMNQLKLVEEQYTTILIDYWREHHKQLPHIMNFSGGRSSAMLTLELAKNRQLNPERGDIILFANTSAEHPATYTFANQVCDEIEGTYQIPCLWFEFTTAERYTMKKWRRYATYKLVNRHKKATPDDDPSYPGYHDDGSVFEHLISWKFRMPDRRARLCTQYMKIAPNLHLLQDWLSGQPTTPPQGENLTPQAEPPDEYREYCFTTPPSRPAQTWADFSPVAKPPNYQPVDFWKVGNPTEMVKILGLRSDEPKRVARMEERNLLSEGAGSKACQDKQQPPGEHIYSPLATSHVRKHHVLSLIHI